MKKIEISKITGYLKDANIDFKITGKIKEEYYLASFFEPINNGFYFNTSDKVSDLITKSLILSNRVDTNNSANSFILIKENPQEIYYKIIAYLFSQKATGVIQNTSVIHPEAKIGKNVQIDHFCVIGNCVIEENVIIKSHCVIEDNTLIKKNTIIENHSNIGARGMAWVWDTNSSENKIILPQLGGVIIEENCVLGSNSIIVRGSLNERSIIEKNSILAPGCRIGHGTKIGKFVHLANNVVTGGNVVIGDYSFIGSSASFRPKTKIDKNTIVGTGSVVIKNTTKENITLIGIPAKEIKTNKKPSGIPKLKKQ